MPINMAVMAASPKESFPFRSSALPRDRRARYFLPSTDTRIVPHMTHTLIISATVAKVCAVMLSAFRLPPSCSAAAWATWVS